MWEETSLDAARLLDRVADELEEVSRLGREVEEATASLLAKGPVSSGDLRGLQRLDLMLQSIQALEGVTRRLAHADLQVLPVQALLSPVHLRDMQARLAGASQPAAEDADDELW
ncbi:hypothetical protein [Tranquillimonas alkanivorans]|uniref:Uncharacterized protein n=1 Tax=Tranquillimonas alkanivorans TaxID=441119 RepID=A0A1I5SAU0_9RHOB|nr:hypothetical protein [Tranquillimonas alkanivorans]SFP67829.1 hypothetical protein SAMN04488047_110132 [Tranquillimonas alkanivorans]